MAIQGPWAKGNQLGLVQIQSLQRLNVEQNPEHHVVVEEPWAEPRGALPRY